MADQTSLRNRVAKLESQVQRMMELLGQAPEPPPVALFPLVDTLHLRVEMLQKAVGDWPDLLDKRVTSAIEEASILTDAVYVRVDGIQVEVNLLKQVVGRDDDRALVFKVKVPDPKPFGSAHSAKELENFLWDMETYFQAARIPEAEKVTITSMYLTGNAKLWWRTRLSDDASANRDKIETWDVWKKELKDQFLPCNTSWLARESPRKLKHAGVRDLPSAIVAANRLVDFGVSNSSDPEKKKNGYGKEKGKSGKGWKDGKYKKMKHQEVTGSGNKETVQSNIDRTKKGCYLCNGDHRMRDCPKQGKLNILVAEADVMRVDPQWSILCSCRIKAVNSEAKPIQGVACVELKVSAWTGKCSLMVVSLDDFDVILGMDFLLLANAMDFVRSMETKDSLMSAIQEFKDVFPPELPKKLPPRRAIDHAIELEPGERPPVQALYRMAPAELAELRKQLDGLLEAGLVQPSKAPYGSPVLFQRKQDGSMEYLRSGYWQVWVVRGDEPKTTCVTRYVSFEFLVMPFGLTNAPAMFCNMMNDVLYEYLDWFVVVYLDDIVIYSETLNEHVKHLRAVFQRLREYELYAKKENLPQFDKPFEVQVDASDRALGGVLVQDKHPVAFESRKLKDAELRYNTHEKETTAVVHYLEAWRHYLLGTKFTVVTDNVANKYFKMQRKLSLKQARWQEFLGEFDFEWVHRQGKHNDVADALSRKLVEDGLLYAKDGRVFVPTGTLRRRLLRETHDPLWAGHPGIDRMVALLARRYYWPRMEEDVEAYVRTCLVCQLDKVERKKEAGLLQPLPIPEVPRQSVPMDSISGFPMVNGMTSILVVVDRFSKCGIFISAPHACPAETATELFKNVTKYFGVPKDIVSDRDARFTGRFWATLFNMMETELKFSTANHPQIDGQTERVNALVEDYLRHYVSASQRNWVDLLDVA
ncbi:RNA-directed DNA polymerase [Sesamum angolense]|uniref:RNA-directed DNA polymerase n=1 Tax=Sesamum angolense TaxID=2727404 RepID=A0AAE2BU94_9LAMI|nr:RNA-directed DNA polymerase [Sesamum angolense]